MVDVPSTCVFHLSGVADEVKRQMEEARSLKAHAAQYFVRQVRASRPCSQWCALCTVWCSQGREKVAHRDQERASKEQRGWRGIGKGLADMDAGWGGSFSEGQPHHQQRGRRMHAAVRAPLAQETCPISSEPPLLSSARPGILMWSGISAVLGSSPHARQLLFLRAPEGSARSVRRRRSI